MDIDSVEIVNFKSIKQVKLKVNDCNLLVGENESGKSNILMAMSLLDKTIDLGGLVRYPSTDEVKIDKSYVRFLFVFDDDDYKEISLRVKEKILNCNDLVGIRGGEHISIDRLLREVVVSCSYVVDLKECTRYGSIPGGSVRDFIVNPSFRSVKNNCPKTLTLDGVRISDFNYVFCDCGEDSEKYLTKVDKKNIYDLMFKCTFDHMYKNIPNVMFWKYSDASLFSNKVNINSFCDDVDSCIPIRNVFIAAGFVCSDISKEIVESRKLSPHAFWNLLRRVSLRATERLKTVWPDSCVGISLRPEGEHILCGIEDKCNYYEINNRSDGFKRIVSFLLGVASIGVDSDNDCKTVVIMDEPDLGLHPSAIKMMREEIVKISKSHVVFASTHSPFMVDRENLERHIIVNKNNGETLISRVRNSNFFSEEVVFNALSHSVFSVLKKQNVIVEGWTDKKMLDVALDSKVKAHERFLAKLRSEYGICVARGCSGVRAIATIMELANRNFIVMTDSDEAAIRSQKDFINDFPEAVWVRYSEALNIESFVTVEDFFKKRKLKSELSIFLSNICFDIDAESVVRDSLKGDGILKSLERALCTFCNKKSAKEYINDFKRQLFRNVSSEDIRPEFFKVLNVISREKHENDGKSSLL